MGDRTNKSAWEVERRGFRGTDLRTDKALLPENVFSDSKNLTLEGGMVKTRPGSTRYGLCSFSGLVGAVHKMVFVSTLQGEWALIHIGAALYVALTNSGAAPTRITDLAGANVVVADQPKSSFTPIQLDYDTSGFRIYKILHRTKSACKVLEYREQTGVWLGRSPSLTLGSTDRFSLPIIAAASTVQPAGTYRVRMRAARIIDGVRVAESPCVGRDSAGNDTGYQQVTITAAQSFDVEINAGGFPTGATHMIVEITRVLSLVGDSAFSNNGNDPSIFYEAAVQLMAFPYVATVPSPSTINLNTPTQDTRNFQAIPGHDISVFSGGLIFFGGLSAYQSRIFIAGASGLAQHSEMYDPALFIPADEADGKALTALEIVGNHLGIWKENKTGVLLNRDYKNPVTWRDRKVGAAARDCVSMLTENQAIVLCHDGKIRVFNGLAYDRSLELGDADVPLSEPIRPLTETIDPATASFVWHRERLHLLHGLTGQRRALQLLPDEGYGWFPWDGLTHEINALAENETKWIFLEKDDGLLYEQSPLDGATLDRGVNAIEWRRRDAPLWPKVRKNVFTVEDCLIEGEFDLLTEASFVIDESRIETAMVGLSPAAGVKTSKWQRWFKCWQGEGVELTGHGIELELQGVGPSKHRATFWRVVEEAILGLASIPSAQEDPFAYLPTWGADMVHYARFDRDAETQYDYGGSRRNLTWKSPGGGLRTHMDDMPPYGGEVLQRQGAAGAADPEPGYHAEGWDGMDGLGDNNGANSSDQVFEAVFSPLDGEAASLELATGPNGTWRIELAAGGQILIKLYTYGATTKRWQWATAAGLLLPGAPLDPYVLQLALYGAGDGARMWLSKASESLTERTLTRTALATDGGYVGDRVIGQGIAISHFRRLLRSREAPQAMVFHNLIKSTL